MMTSAITSCQQDPNKIDPEALEHWVETISIRGRLAYALLCIESACEEWQIQSARVRATLNIIWEFTSSMDMNLWEVKAQEEQPDLFLVCPFSIDDQEWRDFVRDWDLSGVAESRAEALGRMLLLAMDVAQRNLYTGYDSADTAEPLKDIINILQIVGVELPDRSRVSLSRPDEKHGWGDPHPPEFFR